MGIFGPIKKLIKNIGNYPHIRKNSPILKKRSKSGKSHPPKIGIGKCAFGNYITKHTKEKKRETLTANTPNKNQLRSSFFGYLVYSQWQVFFFDRNYITHSKGA